jgi:hypothetical protein
MFLHHLWSIFCTFWSFYRILGQIKGFALVLKELVLGRTNLLQRSLG